MLVVPIVYANTLKLSIDSAPDSQYLLLSIPIPGARSSENNKHFVINVTPHSSANQIEGKSELIISRLFAFLYSLSHALRLLFSMLYQFLYQELLQMPVQVFCLYCFG